MTNETEAAADISYSDAANELDAIIAALESDELDVDGLAKRVERAAVLIDICRGRIDRARVEVERIVVGLDAKTEHDS
ncbi:exodeoxyribonuclease VII small subunit [Acidimicrobium ferrooxidans]|uniref:Exodeoxyribonuclease VII small subunit n=1 Tax=Acidimicrobium ferrooxidans TaxID=53635 RepID=A0ABS3AP75_9ACTN|nr:exodeoxyribonuclease VII small subunit [Acidimicrobium ferrooxidans]